MKLKIRKGSAPTRPANAIPQAPSSDIGHADHKVVAITLIYVAVALTTLEYFANAAFAARTFPSIAGWELGLYPHLWWACLSILVYAPVPILIVKLIFKRSLRDYGLTLAVTKQHLALYGAMLLVVLPIVFYVSTRTDFLNVYPFYRNAPYAPLGAVLAWEIAYGIQFIALEFFFRGFLVLGLQRYVGRYAIWIAVVPYCMIHFHKPPLEAFAAIVAGIVLGEVAQRTRSIMGGVLVHLCVALTMDALAIHRVLGNSGG